jgi:hypothetical protein
LNCFKVIGIKVIVEYKIVYIIRHNPAIFGAIPFEIEFLRNEYFFTPTVENSNVALYNSFGVIRLEEVI